MVLPKRKKPPVLDIGRYTWLIYGREKIGKTTLLSQWPDMLVLPTEPGTKGLEIYEVPIKRWEDMLAVTKDLEADTDRFSTVAIDTATQAYNMALDYTCKRLGIPYPGESASGKEDFGKSWKQVSNEFTEVIKRIINTGRGVVFTSHAQEIEIRHRNGTRYNRIIPSMPGQARKVIEALVDIAIYCEYFRKEDGTVVRVMVCEGDDMVWAGARRTGGSFPSMLPLLDVGGYDVLAQAFMGQHPGLDPATLMPANQTFSAATGALAKAKKGGAARPLKKAAKKKPIKRR